MFASIKTHIWIVQGTIDRQCLTILISGSERVAGTNQKMLVDLFEP